MEAGRCHSRTCVCNAKVPTLLKGRQSMFNTLVRNDRDAEEKMDGESRPARDGKGIARLALQVPSLMLEEVSRHRKAFPLGPGPIGAACRPTFVVDQHVGRGSRVWLRWAREGRKAGWHREPRLLRMWSHCFSGNWSACRRHAAQELGLCVHADRIYRHICQLPG